ncbi:MAG: cytochrome P450 [Novosphingobium sp.]|uniref:cytochrome P450 n=1 Tax=Novosphingobium sp. TaxID=1874826 RepID=UPI00391A3898
MFRKLQEEEPVSWVPALNMWMVTRYADVKAILLDHARFSVRSKHSLVLRVLGEQMLSQDGKPHDLAKQAFQHRFRPNAVRSEAEALIMRETQYLLDTLEGPVDLRRSFAARLPIRVMLALFGMPAALESDFRQLYSAIEAALSNHRGDPAREQRGLSAVAALQELFAEHAGFDESETSLGDDACSRNLTLIFFGGISTVEALLLNAVWALLDTPQHMKRARNEPGLLPQLLHETMRWSGPVQSASRHCLTDVEIAGVVIAEGDTVACMLGAANRDKDAFADPDHFDPDRANLRSHLGFAAGAHFCLGSHLAMLQVQIAIGQLLAHFPRIESEEAVLPALSGHEFRQPAIMPVILSRHVP